MNSSLISVITATYNAESTLERTLRSVESQVCGFAVEHIIVDGKSADDTMKIVKDYVSRNPSSAIRVVSEPDRGLYDALNKGIGMATGRYLCFLNAGDTFHSADTLQTALDGVDADAVGIVYGDTDIVDSNGKFLHLRNLRPPHTLSWRSFRNGMLVCHQSFYVRRDIAQEYDLKYRFSADFDWCIRVMREGERLGLVNHFVDASLTNYLEEGLTTRNHKASLIERFRIMSHFYGLVPTILRHFYFLICKQR